jgi:shikimate dehydrogenase
MRRCGVVGDPIEHSLSPVLHRAAYAELGLDWTYDAVRVPAGGLAEFVDGLDADWRGLSLTMPLKREVTALLTSQDEWTRVSGVANTLLLDESGERHGLNTDVPGAEAALARATDTPLREAVVLGGGATAVSALLALAERGLAHATLAVRDPARAGATVAAVGRHARPPEVTVIPLAGLEAVTVDSTVDVVVSTIPVAAQTGAVLRAVRGVPVVFDVVYDPWPTPLSEQATADGRTVVSGLDLLLWQAVDQVRAMTGRFDVPVDAMRRAGEAGLAERRPGPPSAG